jgi:hypothetical protein
MNPDKLSVIVILVSLGVLGISVVSYLCGKAAQRGNVPAYLGLPVTLTWVAAMLVSFSTSFDLVVSILSH